MRHPPDTLCHSVIPAQGGGLRSAISRNFSAIAFRLSPLRALGALCVPCAEVALLAASGGLVAAPQFFCNFPQFSRNYAPLDLMLPDCHAPPPLYPLHSCREWNSAEEHTAPRVRLRGIRLLQATSDMTDSRTLRARLRGVSVGTLPAPPCPPCYGPRPHSHRTSPAAPWPHASENARHGDAYAKDVTERLIAMGGGPPPAGPRDALEGKGPPRRPQKRLDRRLEEVAKAVGGSYCRLQGPLKLALGIRETVAGSRLGALEGGLPLPFPMHLCLDPPHPPLDPDFSVGKNEIYMWKN